MKIKLLIPCMLLLVFHVTTSFAQQTVFINEVMASNDTTIADSNGNFDDWIELYNSGSSAVPLNNYYISNDSLDLVKYKFIGNLQIPAHGYLILWASGITTSGPTHLPFKVSASGEKLYLSLPDGITNVDSAILGQQRTDISYGRTTNGAPNFSFFAKPTPDASNNSSTAYLGVLDPPNFSVAAGFYANPFSLTITSPVSGTQIIYTLDGSVPDAGNLAGTTFRYKNKYQQAPNSAAGPFLSDSYRSNSYSGPLSIIDASTRPNRLSTKSSTSDSAQLYPLGLINKGTVVRAIAIKSGYLSSKINTATYFVTPGATNKYTLPVICLAGSENNFFSYDDGLHNAGIDFEQYRAANPSLVLPANYPANWRRDIEFPASFELFKANSTTRELQVNLGWTINGNASSAKKQKAIRLYFRSEYGQSNLNYPILPDLPNKDYERLILHNSGQDMNISHLRNVIVSSATKHLNFDTEHGTPAIAFVNGEFWGLLNPRERFDDNYFHQLYGITSDSLDYNENQQGVLYGTNTAIINLRSFISANDLSVAANYQNIQTMIDIDNFIDYEITEVYIGNTDWPHNNLEYFRKRIPYTPGASKGLDGRFRFVLHDVDVSLGFGGTGPASYNTLAWATGTRTDVNPVAWSTQMITKLLANTQFRNKFISRYADLLNTSFLPANLGKVIATYRDMVAPHIAEHIDRWRQPANVSTWNTFINVMTQYSKDRPAFARQHLRDLLLLSTEKQLTVDVDDSTHGFVMVNTVDITPSFPGVPAQAYPWQGMYYPEVPVTLVAKAKPGFRFNHWEGDNTSTLDTITLTLSSAKSVKAFFDLIQVDTPKVFTYWHFNNAPSGTLTSITADTTLPGNSFVTYPGTGGIMDRSGATEGSSLNLQFGKPSGFSLRPRNPSSTRSLLITAPTTGFKNVKLTYASSRSSSGAQYQRVSYTTDNVVWQLKTDSILLTQPETNFAVQTTDFSSDAATANNPLFAIKIEFFGSQATGTSGNNRFDNIALSGIQLTGASIVVSADRNGICATSKVTFTAAVTNAGQTPSFQWIKNDVNVGSNSNIFIDSNFVNGDVVYCTLTANALVTKSNKLTMSVISSTLASSLSITPASACDNDGIIVINPSGGNAPYDYSLDNFNYSYSNVFDSLPAGNYTTYTRDAKGCTVALADVVAKTPTLLISGLTKTNPSPCASDGGITINITGGNPPFLYSLDDVNYVSSNVFSNLAAGNYTVYVKDSSNCSASLSVLLTATPSSLVITGLTKTAASACGNDGSITINVSGGSSPYTYSTDNVIYLNTNTFNNLAAGNVTAYVKDANGCITSLSDVIAKASALVISSISKTAASCAGNNGKIVINASGGTAPLQYSMDNVSYVPSNSFSNLPAGNFTAYVRDARNCITSTSDVIASGTSSLVITSLTKTAASACGNDGQITINKTGGTSPFTYSLNNVDFVPSNVFPNLAAGPYTVYVKDAVGCSALFSDVISKVATLTISLSKIAASGCQNDGQITINKTGGTSPFQYSLNGGGYVPGNVFSNLSAGTYTASVKDARGCIASTSTALATSTTLVITNFTKVSASCKNDGQITINMAGGTSPFQYSLNGGSFVAGNLFINLAAGSYTASVKDARGCTASFSDVLSAASSTLAITGLSKVAASSCKNDGQITINRTGGTSPFQYSLNGSNYVSSNVFGNLAAGPYTAYVKDSKGCTVSVSDAVAKTATLSIPGLSKVTASACRNDGQITVNKIGGTAPFTYSLNGVDFFSSNVFTNLAGGINYTATVKDSKGCTATITDALSKTAALVITSVSKTNPTACTANGQITINRTGGTSPFQYSLNGGSFVAGNLFINLAAGSYTASVKDARGCTASFSVVLSAASSTLAITGLSKVAASSCKNDGQITINRTGGTSPFQYSLNGSNYVSSNVFGNLAAGPYTAYVKDSKGCTVSVSDAVAKTATLSIPGLSKVTASACRNDGQITVNKIGGTAPFTYSLNGVDFFSSNVFTNLAGGINYTATVKDSKGCTATITDALSKTAALVITSVSKTNPTACTANGKITINRSGGNSPFQYSVNNAAYFTSNIISNLAGGTYTAYVKDAKNCITTISNIVLTAPACSPASRAAEPKFSARPSTKLRIIAFPNPSTEQFSVIAQSANNNRQVEVIVTDLAGRRLLHIHTQANNVFRLGKDLRGGSYIIEALQGNEKAILKIVKGQ